MSPAAKVWWAAGMAGVVSAVIVAACSPATPPQAPQGDQARALARSVIEVAETAWMQTAQACVDVAGSTLDQNVLDKCEAAMGPSAKAFDVANSALDTWTAVDQKNYACAAKEIVLGITTGAQIVLKAGGKVTPIVADLQTLANLVPLNCDTGVDAGGQ